MILVTVGSMMAFDRLIRAMDQWAKEHPDQDLLAQIGGGSYVPNHMRWTRMMPPSEFKETVKNSTIMVAHAGMGSYLIAMEMRKPVVLLPRHASAGEHTTEHQLHTIEWLRHKPGVYAAKSEDELAPAIDKALVSGSTAIKDFCRFAPEPFLLRVRQSLLE